MKRDEKIIVYWKDAISYFEKTFDEACECEAGDVETAGFFITQTKKKIVVACEKIPNDGYRHVHAIPKDWVTKIKKMKK